MSRSSAVVTVLLEQAEIAELDRLAQITRRSRSQLLTVAVRRYIDYKRDFLAAVDEGIADARAGHVVGHDVILADSAARRQRSRTLQLEAGSPRCARVLHTARATADGALDDTERKTNRFVVALYSPEDGSMAAKRELIEVNSDKRYVTRAPDGTFKKVVDVSASLSADARQKAKTKVKPGHGDKGDR